jgi:hypothetical protein
VVVVVLMMEAARTAQLAHQAKVTRAEMDFTTAQQMADPVVVVEPVPLAEMEILRPLLLVTVVQVFNPQLLEISMVVVVEVASTIAEPLSQLVTVVQVAEVMVEKGQIHEFEQLMGNLTQVVAVVETVKTHHFLEMKKEGQAMAALEL